MCGVVAVRALAAGPDVGEAVRRGLAAIARRGPDGEGCCRADVATPTVLGHRRLSILDLSDAAAQPMVCPDTGNVLVFNGEIYNFIELRRELEALGHVFVSNSDSEVLLHGWRAWGEALFSRCNGMWAVILCDRATGDLVFCRDRLGVKPLYLFQDARHLVLASEVRAIVAVLGSYPAVRAEAVFDFLAGGVSEHTCGSFFAGIEHVPPGQLCRMRADGTLRLRPYHTWPESGVPLGADALRELVRDATRLRLRSDVPTVSLLSGGLDSSILTWLSLESAADPRTHYAGAFTYGYADPALAACNEIPQASRLMTELGARARHHVMRAQALPDLDELLDLVATQEEPFCTPSILASFRVYRAIREAGFTVVLNGEGADELFGGYIRLYLALCARDALRQGAFAAGWQLFRSRAVTAREVANRWVWELPAAMLGTLLRRSRPSIGVMADTLWQSQSQRLELLREDRRADVATRLRRDVLQTNLPMIMRMTDRNSMRFGVEVRSPFLDYRIVEAALATPVTDRMGRFHGKALLRQAFDGMLPARVLWQRKSTGFGHAEQFLVDRLPVQQILSDLPSDIEAFIDRRRLRAAMARGDTHSTMWLALALVLWWRSIHG